MHAAQTIRCVHAEFMQQLRVRVLAQWSVRSRTRTHQPRSIATKEVSRPKQAGLRRRVSAAYDALFHLLVDAAAHRLVSAADRQPLRNGLARAFDHGTMKRVARPFPNVSMC